MFYMEERASSIPPGTLMLGGGGQRHTGRDLEPIYWGKKHPHRGDRLDTYAQAAVIRQVCLKC